MKHPQGIARICALMSLPYLLFSEQLAVPNTIDAAIHDMRMMIKYLPNQKAPGVVRITNEMLKILPKQSLTVLLEIFIALLKLTALLPGNWSP